MLDEYWSQHFGETEPIAHGLRVTCRDRWVRFHSLPDSKRYAETGHEWAMLLERHNTIVGQLATNESQLELLTTNWSGTQFPGSPADEFCELKLSADPWRTVAMHEIDGEADPNYWHVFRSSIRWTPGSLDHVIRLVANDRLSNVMILDPADSWLLHPYDGGMDVILGSRGERDTLSTRFATWRSTRSDGL